VDGSRGGEEEIRGDDSARPPNPEPIDPGLVQEKIPESGGLNPSPSSPTDGSRAAEKGQEKPITDAARIAAETLNRRIAEIKRRVARPFSEADFYKVSKLSESDTAKIANEVKMRALEVAKLETEVEKLKIENTQRQADMDERKKYAVRLFKLILGWLFAVLLTVWFSAVRITMPSWWPTCLPLWSKFDLTDTVLVTLIGSTTATVIGLLVIVVRYLFPNRDGDN
jgi:hypothetical protein